MSDPRADDPRNDWGPGEWYQETLRIGAEIDREYRLRTQYEDDIERLTAELKIKSEWISTRQCPDHSGKWPRGQCLQCDNERLRATIDRVHELIVAGRYQAAEVECEALQHKDPDEKGQNDGS